MIEYAGALISRFEVGKDGQTPFRRNRGKDYRRELPEFGENVHYMPIRRGRAAKLESRFEDAVFLGIHEESDELYVGTEKGVFKIRNVKRKPPSQRWDRET